MNTTGLKRIGQGIECQVYEVNTQIVCKNFAKRYSDNAPEPKRAQFAYRMQRIAYRYGLAPRPLAIEDNQYYSERAESFDDSKASWLNKDTREFEEFMERMFKVLGDFRDNHSGNIARLSDGRLCCIDFGVCGFQYSRIGMLLMDKIGIEL